MKETTYDQQAEVIEAEITPESEDTAPEGTPEQIKESRPTVYEPKRIHENEAMPYYLEQIVDVNPNDIKVVRWPKDKNDQWKDSKGKAFPIDSNDIYRRKATIRDNPTKDLKYVVKYAGRGAFIGNLDGDIVVEVPLKRRIQGKEYQIQNWMWLDNRTLVGVMTYDLNLNDQVEYGDTRIHLFKINDDMKSGQLVEVNTPFIPHRSTIKIEGITSDGALVLSRVYDGNADGVKFNYATKNYSKSGYEPEKFLGVFEVKKQSLE